MNEIVNQFKRLFSDNGRNDKDFTEEELKLRAAKQTLDKAIADFKHAADNLYSVLLSVD